MIPILLGANPDFAEYSAGAGGGGIRLAGNVVWLSDIRLRKFKRTATEEEGGGGKKSPKVADRQYTCDMAVMFSEGEQRLEALYFDADLVFDARSGTRSGAYDPTAVPPTSRPQSFFTEIYLALVDDWKDANANAQPTEDVNGVLEASLTAGADAMRWYSGTETQPVDPLIEAAMGVGETPAYLGRAYLVLENFDITPYGRIPNITAIVSNKTITTTGEIISHLAERAGLEPDEYSVGGLSDNVRGLPLIGRAAPRETIALLGSAFGFVYRNTGGVLAPKVLGGSPEFAFTDDDLGYATFGERRDNPVALEQAIITDLAQMPARLDIQFFDPGREGEPNTAGVQRLESGTQAQVSEEINLVLTFEEARRLAQRLLDTVWREQRQKFKFAVGYHNSGLAPGQSGTVTLDGDTHRLRLQEMQGFIPGVFECDAVIEHPSTYAQDQVVITSPGLPTPVVIGGGVPVLTFIDRFWREQEIISGKPGAYIAVCSYGGGWRGAGVYRDKGSGYQFLLSVATEAVLGRADTVLAATETGSETVDVQLLNLNHSLTTYATGQVAEGKGLVMIGEEIFQYRTATQLDDNPNLWRLSNLSNRGAKCTTAFKAGHAVDERFVVLNDAVQFLVADSADIGQAYDFKAIAPGMSVDDAGVVEFEFTAPNLVVETPADYALELDIAREELLHSWSPASSACTVLTGLMYEIYLDSSGSPGALLWSGTSNSWREPVMEGTRTYHFRAKNTFGAGNYEVRTIVISFTLDNNGNWILGAQVLDDAQAVSSETGWDELGVEVFE